MTKGCGKGAECRNADDSANDCTIRERIARSDALLTERTTREVAGESFEWPIDAIEHRQAHLGRHVTEYEDSVRCAQDGNVIVSDS